MVRYTKYEPGTPSWADVASPDVEASRAFYGGLFGWTGEPSTDPEAGGYMVFMQGDAKVAGLGPVVDGITPHWSVYVTVADIDETAANALAAGGQVLMEPMDVLEAGRMAIIADPTGAALALWQPREHIGAEVRMQPGTFCWAELNTRDSNTAVTFFERLFGWKAEPQPMPGSSSGFGYITLKLDDTNVAGIITMDENWPTDVPAHWMSYFAVTDCDVAAARVTELGGQVCVPPTDIPQGRFAVVNDPHGAVFTIIVLNREIFGQVLNGSFVTNGNA
ncbi:MAG: VOC family protein [Acidimicrobiaceae bacterium]|nr:VOC family protein [Acidimicrobiaceae bacterium]